MSWEVKKLGKIGNVFSGNSINAKTKKEKFLNVDSGIPYVATKDISYDSIINYDNGVKIPEKDLCNFRMAHKNSIFVCAEGGSAGRKLAFNTKDVCFVNKLFALETFAFMEPRFVYYFYHTNYFQESFKSQMTGLIGGVSIGKFKNLEIPVPPLPIQKKIVSILDKSFEKLSKAKENAEKNLKNAKDVFESYLQSVFGNKGKGGEDKPLGKIAYVKSGGTPLRYKKEYWDKGNIPWYSSGELNDLYTKDPARHITKKGLDNSNAKLFPKGSLLIGMYDTAALKMSIIDRDATFNQAIAGVKPNEKLDLTYVLHAINSIKADLLNQRRGVRQKNLSLEKIKNISLFIPPLIKQKSTVSILI